MKFFITLCLTLLSLTGIASAISDKQAVKAIVGEAAGESYFGKVAVAAAIRNRGNLRGVYGVHSSMIYQQPASVWREALKAWRESETNDPTHGASYWESTDFKKPYWADKMHVTAHIGKHVFYKP